MIDDSLEALCAARARAVALATELRPIGSPCCGVCRLDRETGYCEGCLRTRDEIKAWKTMTDDDKLRVLSVLSARSD
ncbi:DUF1289 domain-containing protein [Trinickia fusca]|uniref:DUF1289 domain-containing protein n=1 Tax=Trinickia fusca TaxID=2419777 RepID=A0A494XJ34_9BURK|nr:DUF1289 domain-containing protein [Trinickia fusca]RKP48129.1 DUF1289 domain-containing protein [Trinickia fusca]